jgi:hypothetical protein
MRPNVTICRQFLSCFCLQHAQTYYQVRMAHSMLPMGYHTSETSKENLQCHEISRIPVFRDVTRHRCVGRSWRFERTRCCPSRSTHPAEQRHIPGHWNPQGRHCERLRTHAWSPLPFIFYVYAASTCVSSTSLDQKEQGYSVQPILINELLLQKQYLPFYSATCYDP